MTVARLEKPLMGEYGSAEQALRRRFVVSDRMGDMVPYGTMLIRNHLASLPSHPSCDWLLLQHSYNNLIGWKVFRETDRQEKG